MMKNKLLNKFLFILSLPVLMLACSDDEGPKGTGTDFKSIATTIEEAGGTATIPLRNGSISESDIVFGGTATEGEDFEFSEVTAEGVQISIINDDKYEGTETIRVQIKNTTGNNIHTITIPCDGTDAGGWAVADFAGDWDALEDYGAGGTYGPYDVTLVQDDVNPNRFDFDNFYDAGRDVYMIFDLEAGTVVFPDQTPLPDATPDPLTGSTGTFDLCEGTLTINLNYDGSDWVYRFTQH